MKKAESDHPPEFRAPHLNKQAARKTRADDTRPRRAWTRTTINTRTGRPARPGQPAQVDSHEPDVLSDSDRRPRHRHGGGGGLPGPPGPRGEGRRAARLAHRAEHAEGLVGRPAPE